MEIRTLKYFLAVVQEGSLSNAAKRLHVTQPTLSRQLAALEEELGRQLFIRNHSGLTPTEHGVMLMNYADSIVGLADKAKADISLPAKNISGSVHIAAGVTKAMRSVVSAMKRVREEYPAIDFQLYSGTTSDLMDGFVRGKYDFLLECEVGSHRDFNVLILPERDRWGVIMRSDDPLASRSVIRPEDVVGHPMITSRQGSKTGPLKEWLGPYVDKIDVVGTYDLPSNLRWLIEDEFGIAFAYEHLVSSDISPNLTFVPFEPALESRSGIVWRKTLPSQQAQVFLDVLTAVIAEERGASPLKRSKRD